jgi:hypothetical protein
MMLYIRVETGLGFHKTCSISRIINTNLKKNQITITGKNAYDEGYREMSQIRSKT